jgi:hypothetical protein
VIPYQSYQLWQLERVKTTAEQRAADAQRGMFAAAAARSLRQAARTTVLAGARTRLRLTRAGRLVGDAARVPG